MRYEVQAVNADELPEGTDAVIVERGDGTAVMLVADRPAQVWAAMRQWEDTLEPCTEPSVLLAPPLRLVI
jgi:hypothetical protein